MTDETTISRELILAPSRSIARKKVGLVKRGLELADEIIRLLSAEDYFERGEAKMYADDEGAIKDFTKAIELDPEYTQAYTFRGKTKSNLEDEQGALEDFTKAIKLDPEYIYAYYSRGEVKSLSSVGDYQGAIEDFTKVIELDPEGLFYFDGVWGYTSRGTAKDDLGDYQGAIEDFTKAFELYPEGEWRTNQSLSSRGMAKIEIGDYQGAIEDFTKIIEEAGLPGPPYDKRGEAKYKLGDYHGAIEDLTTAIELNSISCLSYYWRGMAKAKLGDQVEGELDIKWARKLEAANASFVNGIKKYHLRNYHEAIEDFTKAIEHNPRYAVAYYYRGGMKSKIGDQSGSEYDLNRAKELGYIPHPYAHRSIFEEDQRASDAAL